MCEAQLEKLKAAGVEFKAVEARARLNNLYEFREGGPFGKYWAEVWDDTAAMLEQQGDPYNNVVELRLRAVRERQLDERARLLQPFVGIPPL